VEALYAYPRWQAGALLQAGKCHEMLGQWQQATELYDEVTKAYPNTPFTEEAGRRLNVTRQRMNLSAARQPNSQE
jgi:TolA-binding protein